MTHIGKVSINRDSSEAMFELPDESAEFEFEGDTFRVNPNYSELDTVDFMDEANRIDENDPRSIALVKTSLRAIVHEEDFNKFWGACRKGKYGVVEIMSVYWAILDSLTKRPTDPPPGSSTGRRSTLENSKDGSYLRVLDRLDGRPDLQAAVVEMREESLRA